MNSNSDNPKVGKDFQRKVLSIAQKTFNMPFDEEKVVPVAIRQRNIDLMLCQQMETLL